MKQWYMSSYRFYLAIIPIFCLICISNVSIGQIDNSRSYIRIPKDHYARIITDRENHIKYILDTSHIFIEAITQDGNRVWKTDPWKDSKWSQAMAERPVVITFVLKSDSSTHFMDVLAVNYDNSGGSTIDAKTGKIISIGQD